ncbi:4-carboxymuconolactone decarboxylase [Frondihabitans sp. PhB188]|uniref:carboxymuconolactone decarboxylase family protein n=1 Tax=Frondihabitans sp. PhB188 TaxID=2485200 RepID=UPI000F476CBF|nr:carboxymuconolactone decarboxylase family protein [Frondihabitans sp. PhB188]ROQ37024.1 4-carboxymuconolactone decarboxylase [Frondihabitans sp. PhB188]
MSAAEEQAALFPGGGPSPLSTTDPEFWAFYADFAFDQTLAHSSLDRRDRLVYQLAATIAVGAVSEYRVLLGAALTIGVTPVQVKELTYQAVAYVGIARVVDFLFATNDEFAARGIAVPLEGQSTTTPETRAAVGRAKQEEIVGAEPVAGMYASAPDDAVHFQQFLSSNCFGDYYTRTGFDVRQRELITFALLVALGGADNQVRGHVSANLRVGNTRADLLDVLTVLVAYVGYPRTLNGLAQVNEAAPAS